MLYCIKSKIKKVPNTEFCVLPQQITYVEQPLKDPTRALGTYGVKDGDVVVLRQTDRRPPPTQPAFPGNRNIY